MTELPNDLIGTIAKYTTPDLTLTLLGNDTWLASVAYQPNNYFWRTKVDIETIGLVLEEAVVLANGSWRLYYFLVARNYYGDLYDIPTRQTNPTPKLLERGINIVQQISWSTYTVVRDQTIEYRDNESRVFHTIRLPRRVIQYTVVSTRDSPCADYPTISICEDGTAYYTKRNIPDRQIGSDIPHFVTTNGTHLLSRDGKIYHYDPTIPSLDPEPNLPKSISLGKCPEFSSKLMEVLTPSGLVETTMPSVSQYLKGVIVRLEGRGKTIMRKKLTKVSITPYRAPDPWVDLLGLLHSIYGVHRVGTGRIRQSAELAGSNTVLVTK